MDSKVLLIDRDKFIRWYLDYDMRKTFVENYEVMHCLINHGVFSLSAQSLLDDIGYLPTWVVDSSMTSIVCSEVDEVDTSFYDEIIFAPTTNKQQ